MAEDFTRVIGAKSDGAIILALEGDLGSGKTTFSQGFLAYFGIKRATSPTFVIMKKYHIKNTANYKLQTVNYEQTTNSKSQIPKAKSIGNLYHIDCYRIHNSRDLAELNFKEIVDNPNNIILIEWAERIKDMLPPNIARIRFKHKSDNERIVEIESGIWRKNYPFRNPSL